MSRSSVQDLDHFEQVGRIVDLSTEGNTVTIREAGGKRDENVPIRNFAMGQLLKFGDLKKSQAKDMETDEILRKIGEKQLVFKRNEDEILAVVSTEFVNIETRKIDRLIRKALEADGVEIESVESEKGLVTRIWYVLDLPQQNGYKAGIHVRNSVFGASALGLGRFYQDINTGGRIMLQRSHTYRKYHLGRESIDADIKDSVHQILMNMWGEMGNIIDAENRHMRKRDKIDFTRRYKNQRKITKELADELENYIEEGVWGGDDETLMSLVRTISCYATHGNLSSQNRKKLQRMAEDALTSDNFNPKARAI